MPQPIHKRPWVRRSTVLLLLLLIFYGSYRAIRTDPNLKKVRKLQEEFASASAIDWSPEQRREKGQEMRAAMDKLSPAQRDVLSSERQKQSEEQMRRYAQMSATEKIKHLDEQIDRAEKMRQQFAQRNPGGNAQRPQGAPTGSFGAGPSGSGGSSGRGSQPSSAEDREKRRKERLDKSSPEFRAMMDNYRKDMDARRKQRGMKK